jgi:hypothetical protein
VDLRDVTDDVTLESRVIVPVGVRVAATGRPEVQIIIEVRPSSE